MLASLLAISFLLSFWKVLPLLSHYSSTETGRGVFCCFLFRRWSTLPDRKSWPLTGSGILEVEDSVSLKQLRLQELRGLQDPKETSQRLPEGKRRASIRNATLSPVIFLLDRVSLDSR